MTQLSNKSNNMNNQGKICPKYPSPNQTVLIDNAKLQQ